MKLLRTWVFCSSLLLGVLLVNGQETETLGTDLEVADSLEVKEKIL
jgi:hypothetical protein